MRRGARADRLPHAPETGWAKRLLGSFHVTGVFWYRFHCWGVAFLPRWGVGVFITLFTTFFFLALIKIRRAIARNLEAVLGPCGFFQRQLRIWRTMWVFAWCLSERYERIGTDRRFSIDGDMERWKELSASDAGFVMVTAHLGNFEVGSMVPAFEEGRKVHVVREKEADPAAQAFVQEMLDRAGGESYITHFGEDNALAGVELLEALRAGHIVGIQGDRPHSGGRVVEATLFGRPFPLPAGPAALARAAGVALVPIFVLRTGRLQYRVDIRSEIQVQRTPDRERDIAEAMTRVGREVEDAIRSEPHQWFCFRDLWPSRAASSTG